MAASNLSVFLMNEMKLKVENRMRNFGFHSTLTRPYKFERIHYLLILTSLAMANICQIIYFWQMLKLNSSYSDGKRDAELEAATNEEKNVNALCIICTQM